MRYRRKERKTMEKETIECVQDTQSLKGALLVIEEALETGVLPKSFILYNDTWIDEVMSRIAEVMRTKYGIKVPDSEI